MRIERLRALLPESAEPGRAADGGRRESPRTPGRRPTVVAVGNFDGVHRGHQQGLRLAREEARRLEAEFVAVTFDPHPALLLRPDRAPKAITSFPLKAERLAAAGVERLVVLEFGEAIARTSAVDFVDRLLVGRLRAAAVVQGANFRFGRGRAGDLDTLRALGDSRGFRVIEAPSVSWDGEVVSSTRIRRALASGNLELGASLLGAAYEIEGPVVGGSGRGRDLGFPTANVAPEGDVLLPYGVYAADAVFPSAPELESERQRRAVVHNGPRPTFGEDWPSLEAHLLDFAGAVPRLRLRFLTRIRGVRAFAGPEDLCRQLERDTARARGAAEFPESDTRPAEALVHC